MLLLQPPNCRLVQQARLCHFFVNKISNVWHTVSFLQISAVDVISQSSGAFWFRTIKFSVLGSSRETLSTLFPFKPLSQGRPDSSGVLGSPKPQRAKGCEQHVHWPWAAWEWVCHSVGWQPVAVQTMQWDSLCVWVDGLAQSWVSPSSFPLVSLGLSRLRGPWRVKLVLGNVRCDHLLALCRAFLLKAASCFLIWEHQSWAP